MYIKKKTEFEMSGISFQEQMTSPWSVWDAVFFLFLIGRVLTGQANPVMRTNAFLPIMSRACVHAWEARSHRFDWQAFVKSERCKPISMLSKRRKKMIPWSSKF